MSASSPLEGHMLYAKWAKGYKPGFLEVPFDTGVQTGFVGYRPNPVSPEIVRAWEVGWKGSFWDGRLQTSLSVFEYAYADLQIPRVTLGFVENENAAAAENRGIELELRANPVPEWTLLLTGGWLDATAEEYCSDDPAVVGPSDPACAAEGIDLIDLSGTISRMRLGTRSPSCRLTSSNSATSEP